jgi:HK97 family phage prohead protease
MLHKSFQVLETKADGEHGEFTAIVSTFGNVDRVGDRIMPGAWSKSLKQWQESGDPVPIVLAHQWNDPMAHIGIAQASDVRQVKQGLQVTGKLDVEDNPVAKQVYKLMKRRSLKEFSIGYDVPAGGEKRAADGANEISEIYLAECGPCLKGIDPKTELQAVKSALDSTHLGTADAQRTEAKRVERELEAAQLPDVSATAAEKATAGTSTADLPKVQEELRQVKAELQAVKATLEEGKRLSAAEQRSQAKRIEREIEEQQIPDLPPREKTVTEPVEDKLQTELQEVKARLDTLEKALEDQKTKTVEVMERRSVDPLRQQAEGVALDIASGGLDRLPQRQAKAAPEPDLVDLDELKRKSRDLMLQVLSGVE